jgi:glucose-6-phosphate 1-dehydrogenase
MDLVTPAIVVIIGVTGDLAKRKLLPAIDQLARAGVLPAQFRVVGITRRADVHPESLTNGIADTAYINDHLSLFTMDLAMGDEYMRLANYLNDIENAFGTPAQRLFYLSIPPQVSWPIIEFLGLSGLATVADTKLLLEKPFGTNLETATELDRHITGHFKPHQVYRIDHYLAKEMAQNLIAFREENMLYRRTWNADFIDRVEIIASEKIGIEGRGNFYEQTGALRDLIQSHLLQLAALTLMDIPQDGDLGSIPGRRLKALRHLSIPGDIAIADVAKRGQYNGYRDEANSPKSGIETFASITLRSSDKRWHGVPIVISTGKALQEKNTEIRLVYKNESGGKPNELSLRLQPNEGVSLRLWTKQPGYGHKLQERTLQFAYSEDERLPEAYERVLLDALQSDHSLFATGEEVLETWRIIDPVQRAWEMTDDGLQQYDKGAGIIDLV